MKKHKIANVAVHGMNIAGYALYYVDIILEISIFFHKISSFLSQHYSGNF